MTDSVARFSNRVENYVRYRPGYPPAMTEFFRDELGLNQDSVIADIGSGTGLSTKPFLEAGCAVYGVEPNAAMREAAELFLKDYPRFVSHDGTAENTLLADHSVDFIVAAQAFHWFDRFRSPREFRRILRLGGIVALIWNERILDGNDFLREYENLLKEFGTDYEKVRHDALDRELFEESFGTKFAVAAFENSQTLDFEGLQGRLMSSSYTPAPEHPRFEPMISELHRVFDKYSESGKIQILYTTNVFYTRL
jgi:SAM-dependent methyltransferase